MRATLRTAGFAALILIFVFPMFFMVSASFMSRYEVNVTPPALLPPEFHPENYAEAWSRMNFVHYLRNSLLSTFITIAGQLLACVPCAYAFAKKQFRFKKALYCLVLFDLIVPAQAIFLQMYILESGMGWINTMRGLTAPFFYSAFTIFFLVQYFKTVPDEILDAARLDRCSEICVITRIMAPMASPIIITAMIFTFVYKWNDYFWTSILTTDETVRTLPMAIQNLMPVDHVAREWHIIMAGNVMALAPMLAAYVLANKAVKSGLIYGIWGRGGAERRINQEVMNVKRYFVLLAVGIIFVSAFLGWQPFQGSNGLAYASGGTVEVLFWNVFADESGTGVFLAKAAEDFMKENPGVKITVNGQGGYDAIAERLEAASAGGNLPTMAIIEETFLGRFHPIAEDLSKYLSSGVIDNYQPGLLASGYVGDKLYAAPFNRSMPVLFYNKTMFEASGLKTPPATWDEFRETAKALSDAKRGIRGAGLCWDTDAWIFESILYSWGGDILDDANKKVVFNDGAKASGIVKFFQEMEEGGTLFSPYDHQEDPWITVATEVLQGRVGMMLGSNGMYSIYSQWMADAGFELGMAMHPSSGGKPSIATGGGNIVVFRGATEEQKRAAGKFLEFLARDEYAGEYAVLTGYLPVTKAAMNSEDLSAMLSEKPDYRAVIEQMGYAHRRPFTKNWKNMYGIIVEELEACLSEKRDDAAKAMESAALACQKVMDENPD